MATTAPAIRAAASDTPVRPSRSLWSNAWWKLCHDRLAMGAFIMLALLAFITAGADLLSGNLFRQSFEKQGLLHTYEKPQLANLAYLLGLDEIGRSQVVRLLYGGRVSLTVGFVASIVNLTVGVSVSLTAGYLRGRVDDIFTQFVTTLNSISTIFLLSHLCRDLGARPGHADRGHRLLFWTGISLFVRGQTFALREREFVVAARTIGARDRRIMFRHSLPNIPPLIFVLAAIDIGGIILAESALSFLGLGILPPTPSWGNMLTGAVGNLVRGPWLVFPPGAMIFLTVLCLYLIGDGLRDALDPRVRG